MYFLLVPIAGIYKEVFQWLQLLGFIVMLFGVVVYNELLVLSCWGLDRHTLKTIEYRKNLRHLEKERSLKSN